MPSPRQDAYRSDLQQLINRALTTVSTSRSVEELEGYMTEHSALPGPRMNTALVGAFADVIGRLVTQPAMPPVERLEALLDGWAALSLAGAPANDPREILPSTAVLTYGQVAVARQGWWEDEVAKLRRAALHPCWRVREMVAAALQRMLAANWKRTYQVLTNWLLDDDPLVIRASAAAIWLHLERCYCCDTRSGARAARAIERISRQRHTVDCTRELEKAAIEALCKRVVNLDMVQMNVRVPHHQKGPVLSC